MIKNIINLSIEKIFVLLAILFGILYVFILPPFQSVDEGMHFFRTYQISEGHLTAKKIDGKVGDEIPSSLSDFYDKYVPFIKNIDKKTNLSEMKSNFQLQVEEDRREFTQFTNTALYSPVCYISQITGVIAGKVAKLSLGGIYYLGRLSNLIAYCLLVFFALRITPFFKCPMFLLALMPMSLSLAGSYTCDVAVLGLNFLWMAVILKTMTLPQTVKFTNKWIIMLAILGILIALSKSYILLLPLIFLLPSKLFNSRRDYFISVFGILAVAFAGLAFWSFCIKGLSLDMNESFANSAMQIEFIKTHPLAYILVLIKTFFVKTPRLLITMIGVLGWQDTKLDWITYIAYPVLIYFAVRADNFDFKLEKWQKVLIWAVLIAGTVITYTSLYIMWSPVGNSVVLGLNGKYFIPLMLPLCLIFKNSIAKYDYEKVKFSIIIAVILILASSEMSLLHRFYNITPQLYYKI